ncbi:indolepyruvate ferredoxin oxidoreductase subunit alpha [Metallosphaera hakonensis]|uniref:thiamine pyrophosphate-dependent enzyme n=1 Tax=Metallosphaera hakonensis TaxID=79601 RepID=UPI00197B6565|nr:indolepyruvate ferredoxin oxidoreductase subunit alpha [Metallosphaera hakonensis]
MIMLVSKPKLMLGNEAIAYGALASGVAIAAGYPGTPSTEIIETLMRFRDVYTEWSSNEKVAFETGFGAAMMGARALVTMKHVGMNVASDSLMSSSYTGVSGALVIVSAGDPGMWSSQSEQDIRHYGLMGMIPVLEPFNPQSAHDLTVEAFNLSSSVGHPVIISTNTRISHVRSQVNVLPKQPPIYGKFQKDPGKYSLVPEIAKRDREEQLNRWEKIKSLTSHLVESHGDGEVAILGVGISYSYVREALRTLNIDQVKIVGTSCSVPLPYTIIDELIGVEKVLVIEELDPVVENQLKALLIDNGLHIRVEGKNLTGYAGEMTFERVHRSISKFLGVTIEEEESPINLTEVPRRPPAMCPGCPHRSSFFFLKKGLTLGGIQSTFYSGDIGCYSLGVLPPFNEQDSLVSMGSSLGIANGVYRSTHVIPVAIIGDSTFFHTGLPALANAVYNKLPVLIVVLDNRSTAMTGQQGSPSLVIDIADAAKGIGVKYVEIGDPFDPSFAKTVSKAVEWVKKNQSPALIVAKRACALEVIDKVKPTQVAFVDPNKCTGCTICYDYFTCPAILKRDDKKAIISQQDCIGCGACVPVCPFNAIRLEGDKPEGWDQAWTS